MNFWAYLPIPRLPSLPKGLWEVVCCVSLLEGDTVDAGSRAPGFRRSVSSAFLPIEDEPFMYPVRFLGMVL
jgi:hypothetical protein